MFGRAAALSIWRLSTSTEPLRGGMLQAVDCTWQDGSIPRFCYRRHRGERRIRSSRVRARALPACKTATVYQQTQCGRKQVWRCRLDGVQPGFGQDPRGLPTDRQSMTVRFRTHGKERLGGSDDRTSDDEGIACRVSLGIGGLIVVQDQDSTMA